MRPIEESSIGQPSGVTFPRPSRLTHLAGRPVAAFLLLSLLFGAPAMFLTPPFRGADEPAHFLRAYGIAHGEIVPTLVDAQGRKGIFLPAELDRDYEFFDAMRYRFGSPNFSYRTVFGDYFARKRERAQGAAETEKAPVFVLYAGSEGYSPVAYVPYVAAVLVARGAGLDFVPMLWLMRFAGLVLSTAIIAYAISLVPSLKWVFLFIAMLPIALFERAIVSADGTALGLVMLVAALCLRAVGAADEHVVSRAAWMTLCVLIKPSQTAFVALEAMTRPFADVLRRWRSLLLVVAPGLVLTPIWLMAVSADMAAWRMVEGTGEPAEHFNIGWKLKFLIAHPEHFLGAVRGNLADVYNLWRESIGGLGWRDTHLPLAIYILLSAGLLVSCLNRFELDVTARARIALTAVVTMAGYVLAIFLIFYLAWTPIETQFVHGIQGRYFTIIMPLAAIAIAALVNRGLPDRASATIATLGATISGAATLDAIVRSQW